MRIKRRMLPLSLLALTVCLLVGCMPYDSGSNAPDWMWTDSSFAQEGEDIVTVSTGLTFQSNDNGTCRVNDMGTCRDTQLVIPPVSPAGDRVIAIAAEAFSGCTELRSVVLPDGIEQIGQSAFAGCDRLATINLPDSLRRIGERAFEDCKALQKICVPAATVYIGEMAFDGCRRLKAVTFERTSGWQVTLGESDLWFGSPEKEAKIGQELLTDPARAADFLKDHYVYYNWTR